MSPRRSPERRVTPYAWFIDETKSGGFAMVVISVPVGSVDAVRRSMRTLLRPGQRSLHFTKERPETRRQALDIITAMELEATVYVCKRGRNAREIAVRAIARAGTESRPQRIVFERDESVVTHDRRWLHEEIGAKLPEVEYSHMAKHEEPLLWIADAVAWCRQKGGPWSARVDGLITRVVNVA